MIDPAPGVALVAALTVGAGMGMVRLGLDRGMLQLESVEFLPDGGVGCELLTVRRSESHLFLRYELPRPG